MEFKFNIQSAILISLWLLLSFSFSFGTEEDIACLRSIKASLEDPLGHLNSSWNFDNITQGFICRFSGVECWNPVENRVLNLHLSDMGLRGEFPRGIRNCSSLTGLDLSKNEIYGKIPEDINKLLVYGTSLDLSSNNFSGNIPTKLSQCVYLNTLKLDHNILTGQIPSELGQLRRLKWFSVTNNLLSGQIPRFIYHNYSADSFANNPGLCGEPLELCHEASNNNATH